MSSILSIKGLTHYFGGLRAVSNFNLELPEKKLYGLIGPNGSGKTTIFNLITGIYKPSSGSIKLLGNEITGHRPYKIVHQGIARTFQNLRIFNSLSVLDNIRVARHYTVCSNLFDSIVKTTRCRKEEFTVKDEALDLLNIMKLSHRKNEMAKNLSYGELRKLEIARAMATHPKLLFLDEPAAGMNPKEVSELMELIHFIKDKFKITIFLIEHHMKVVMGICEYIKVIDFGETIAEGLPSEVSKNKLVIEAYLGKGGE